ncbi:hypothetical protein [Rubrobacter aplysinae]|uniref:hypothetical protein n=1 Tax=Rubrobacter aplysinae TaxID=909625 RepID=UPI00069D37EA|nr:hypothetical protein [Rubrobacter aplysinae]
MPENQSGGRRRGGPLGEEAEETKRSETRREQGSGEPEQDATQRIPTDDATQRIPTDDATRQISTEERGGSRGRGGSSGSARSGGSDGSAGRDRSSDTQEFEIPPKRSSQKQEEGKRKGRAPGPSGEGSGRRSAASAASEGSGGYGGYSTGYSDVLRDREEYLRDIYGGVDWLASFVGFIFTLLFAGLLGVGAAIFLLVPLGLGDSLGGGQLTSTAITGFAIIAAAGFFSFLFGGYISGRMARYDGGRNGAMVLLWTVLVAALLLVLSGVLGQAISGTLTGDVVGEALSFGDTAVDLISGLGVSGAVVSGGVILAALLGGMLGGRLGSRYHREIDYTP